MTENAVRAYFMPPPKFLISTEKSLKLYSVYLCIHKVYTIPVLEFCTTRGMTHDVAHLLQLPWFPEIGALPYIGRQSASQASHQGTVQVLQTSSGLHFARSAPQSIDWEMGAGIMHGQEVCIYLYTCTQNHAKRTFSTEE